MRFYVEIHESDWLNFHNFAKHAHLKIDSNTIANRTYDSGQKVISFVCEKQTQVGAPSKKISNVKEKILNMRANKLTIKQITKELGVSRSTVYNYLNEKD